MTDAGAGGVPSRPMIRGAKTFLRPAERSDIPIFVRWMNDDETAGFVTARAPISLVGEEQWFDKMVEDHSRTRWFFVICRLIEGDAIGTIGLFNVDHINGSAGFGIIIGEKELWGHGYGTDALNAVVDFGFGDLRLERIWLEVFSHNPRARRSYQKAGFVLEGTQRGAFYRDGRHLDVELMSILRDEWAALDRPRSWDY